MKAHWSHHLCRPIETFFDDHFHIRGRVGEKPVDGAVARPTQVRETRTETSDGDDHQFAA